MVLCVTMAAVGLTACICIAGECDEEPRYIRRPTYGSCPRFGTHVPTFGPHALLPVSIPVIESKPTQYNAKSE